METSFQKALDTIEQAKINNAINRTIVDHLGFNSVSRLQLFQDQSGSLGLEVVAKNGRSGQVTCPHDAEGAFLKAIAEYARLFRVSISTEYTALDKLAVSFSR